MANKSSGRYYVKNTANGEFADITTMFDGVAILKVDGLNTKGKPVNIYTAQWVNDQAEDFMITTLNEQQQPIVIRENSDIEITFIVGSKYSTNGNADTGNAHDNFIAYMTNSDVWIKSAYVGNKYAHCVCLKEYKPTTVKLQRGTASYIIGTISLHCLDAPKV